MSNVIELRPKKGQEGAGALELLAKFSELVANGDVAELVICARGARDPKNYYYALSPGLTLSDLLMLKQLVSVYADDLWRSM